MTKYFLLTLLTVMLTFGSAHAGTVAISNGQINWQSTRCTPPAEPPSLLMANSETGADTMNQLMTQYNGYTQQVQVYMDCVSSEAQVDSGSAAQAITHSAQAIIEGAQQNVTQLGNTLKAKQQQ
ncbi:MAG: hypothetical protein JO253_04130 [Alphaproteobacteria bacterium]|nr:hypothetical protein [Alphaproteobacteria bacterium]